MRRLRFAAIAATLAVASTPAVVSAQATFDPDRAVSHHLSNVPVSAARFAEDWAESASGLGVLSARALVGFTNGRESRDVPFLQYEATYGNADAKAALGLIHMTPGSVHYDPRQAFLYNIEAAESGEPLAQTSVGLQFLNGLGVSENHREALRWFESAASKGHRASAYQTGVMYLEGDGVTRDLVTARYWLLRAREAGDRRADLLLKQFSSF